MRGFTELPERRDDGRPGLRHIADEAERWLGKPVIAVTIATYWHALRTCGIQDRLKGFTRLMSEF